MEMQELKYYLCVVRLVVTKELTILTTQTPRMEKTSHHP